MYRNETDYKKTTFNTQKVLILSPIDIMNLISQDLIPDPWIGEFYFKGWNIVIGRKGIKKLLIIPIRKKNN